MAIDLQHPIAPISVSEARTGLSQALAAFRAGNGEEEPIFFGSQRKPEGVILSYRQFALLNDAARLLEDLGDVAMLKERLASEANEDASSLDDVAAGLGFDLGELEREVAREDRRPS